MAIADIRTRTGYLFLGVVLGHILLISAQVNSRTGVPVLDAVASRSADGSELYVKVVNTAPTSTPPSIPSGRGVSAKSTMPRNTATSGSSNVSAAA